MPQADSGVSTSRRGVLRMSAIFSVGAAVPAVPGLLKAETNHSAGTVEALLALVTERRQALYDLYDRMADLPYPESEEFGPETEGATHALFDAFESAITPADSASELRAKAVILRFALDEKYGVAGGELMAEDVSARLAWSLVNDIAGALGS